MCVSQLKKFRQTDESGAMPTMDEMAMKPAMAATVRRRGSPPHARVRFARTVVRVLT